MNDQHQRRALSAVAAGLVMLLAGCANAAAAPPASPAAVTSAAVTPAAVTSAATSASTSTASSTRATPARAGEPTPTGDNEPRCVARAMARGQFDSACAEYQGYLDPGTAGGRAPASGEIQQQQLCRSGQIPKTEC